jgi:uncharacterized protein YeeX (DUF496 family)
MIGYTKYLDGHIIDVRNKPILREQNKMTTQTTDSKATNTKKFLSLLLEDYSKKLEVASSLDEIKDLIHSVKADMNDTLANINYQMQSFELTKSERTER